MRTELTPHQREVFAALPLNGVPLDEYVELELAGRDADARLPGMAAHLEGCPACREDHDSLRDFVASRRPGA